MVEDAVSLSHLRDKWAELKWPPAEQNLHAYFVKAYGPEHLAPFKAAQRNFIESMAGYAVVCYLLKVCTCDVCVGGCALCVCVCVCVPATPGHGRQAFRVMFTTGPQRRQPAADTRYVWVYVCMYIRMYTYVCIYV